MKNLVFVIVDDQKSMRQYIFNELRQMILDEEIPDGDVDDIFKESSGEGALKLLRKLFLPAKDNNRTAKRGIVICDLDMGNQMSGKDLFEKCSEDNILSYLEFIIMPANPTQELIGELGEAGLDNILAKSISADSLFKAVKKALRNMENKSSSMHKRAERLIRIGKYSKAMRIIKKGEEKFSGIGWSLLRTRAHLGLQEITKAEEEIKTANTQAFVSSLLVMKNLAEVHEAKGETKKAIEVLRDLSQKSPNVASRRIKLAKLLIQENDCEGAKNVLDALQKTSPAPEKILEIADLLEESGYEEEAVDLRERTLKKNLDDYVFCNALAIDLRKQGKYEMAEVCYKEIVAKHPRQSVVVYNRGINFGAWGNSKKDRGLLRKAKECFKKALELQPDSVEARKALEGIEKYLQKF